MRSLLLCSTCYAIQHSDDPALEKSKEALHHTQWLGA